MFEKVIDQAVEANTTEGRKAEVDIPGLMKSLEVLGAKEESLAKASELEGKSPEEIKKIVFDTLWEGFEKKSLQPKPSFCLLKRKSFFEISTATGLNTLTVWTS